MIDTQITSSYTRKKARQIGHIHAGLPVREMQAAGAASKKPTEEKVMAKSHDTQKTEKKKPLKTAKEKKQAKREKKKG
ncbi:MAG: hypothetical protein AB2L22_11020 [Syntrophales bacterium]